MKIKVKRIYEQPAKTDGLRILIDRLWPRGLSKTKAQVALWLKEIAPSTELRNWFAHDPKRWADFRKRYFKELQANPAALQEIVKQAGKNALTLLYAAKDEKYNNGVALKEYLEKILRCNS